MVLSFEHVLLPLWRPAMTERRAEPFPGTPSQAMKAGYCPSCLGTGRVTSVIPPVGPRDCRTCAGTGLWIEDL